MRRQELPGRGQHPRVGSRWGCYRSGAWTREEGEAAGAGGGGWGSGVLLGHAPVQKLKQPVSVSLAGRELEL